MILINGVRWKIFRVSPSNPYLSTPEGKVALGCCDRVEHTIYINNKLKGKKLKQVLCHEITHAVLYSNNVLMLPKEEEIVAEIFRKYGFKIIELTQKAYRKIK